MNQQKAVTNEDILESINSFVQMVSERFDALEARMDKLEARVTAIEKRLDSIERRLDIVEHDVADLKRTSYQQEHNLGRAIASFELGMKRLSAPA